MCHVRCVCVACEMCVCVCVYVCVYACDEAVSVWHDICCMMIMMCDKHDICCMMIMICCVMIMLYVCDNHYVCV